MTKPVVGAEVAEAEVVVVVAVVGVVEQALKLTPKIRCYQLRRSQTQQELPRPQEAMLQSVFHTWCATSSPC